MNTSLKFLFVLTAVVTLSVAYPARANLITNGGFETGDYTGWTHSGGNTNAVMGTFNGTAPHSGNFQAVLGTNFPFFPSASISQSVATTSGATYTVDFFAAATSGFLENSFTLSVTWGGGTVFSHLFTSDSGYTEYTFNVTASASSTALSFINTGGVGFLLLDDISVTPAGVGVPDDGSTVSLLGFALLGLAALQRKLSC